MLLQVVAAAIVDDGRVLAGRRSRPVALAGRWEFPGGKLEAGEDGPRALARECREELDVEVAVGAVLGVGRDGAVELTLYACTLRAGSPRPGDTHDELRWLDASALASVDWLPIDADLLDGVRPALRQPPAGGTV